MPLNTIHWLLPVWMIHRLFSVSMTHFSVCMIHFSVWILPTDHGLLSVWMIPRRNDVFPNCFQTRLSVWCPKPARCEAKHTNWAGTQRKCVWNLLNQTDIGLYLLFSYWVVAKSTSFWFQINHKVVNTNRFGFALAWFRRDFSVWGFAPRFGSQDYSPKLRNLIHFTSKMRHPVSDY